MTTMTATPTALSVTAAETFGEGSGGDLGTSEAVAMASSISAERRARNRQHGTSAQRAESGVPNEDPYPYLKFSAFIFLAPYQPFRMKLQTIVSNKWFEGAIMLMILISSVMLALDRPTLDPASPMAEAVKIIEWTINILFAIEMIMKMLLKGFIWHRDAYWRNGWDILDGLIVITSLVSMAAPSIAFFRTLRLLRVLRPLRMVSRVRGMRMVVETLIMSLPAVANVLLFGGFMFGIFGILGTQLYMGRTSRCNQNTFANGTAVLDKSMCVPGVFICTDDDICDTIGAPTNRTWVTPYRNFDHLGRSLLTLFIVATLDGYMDTLQAVIDAVGVDKQPQYNHAPYMGMYVISFVFLGSFFWLNLLVSVIIDYYSRLMMQEEGMLADKSMREWMKLLQFTARPSKDIWRSIPVPKNPLRARCWGVASSPYFDNFIMGIIMANVLVMALPHEGSTQTFEDTLAYFNAAFTMVFIFEAVVKNMAMGPRVYIKDNWNKLDLFIVITSIPDLLSLVVPMDSGTGVMTVFRIMRIGRMFKLIKNARGLRTLFNTLISSLPAIANVGSLLFLLMFIYAVLGMNLFGTPGNPFEGDPDSNFNNVGASLVVLFQVFTGDGWSAVMAQASGCDSFEFQCKTNGQALVAAMFFCSFIMLANFVMLNLVIAVILDNFITSAKDEGLLTISNFSETMSKVISLRIFVRSLRTKIELMKAVEELKSFASHDANGGTGATPLLTRDRRAKSRKKPSAINIPLAGVLGKQGESSPAATAGGSLEAAGSMLGRIGTGLGATQGRSSHLSIPSRDEGHSIKRSDSRDATNHSSYFGAIRRALTRQGSSDGGDGAMAAPTRTHGGEESEMGRSRTVSIDGGVGGPAASTLGLTTFLRRRRISSASDV
ncbi:hypothetical protein HXX76_003554 [Chlamydomonas incerta]|uniref:Ion transport domain-containing protein n=1 Tax=Chlamydomonas incerta TaxID=51695 RepID=A0A835W923_CHLIN|nr:hypothetical protein HXX76_003554 [Chlamydomonas incerta]|eukprot:KAG2440696.1 hypothetical protein HXX76_003554 [Chlamydomonas incerta]